MYSVSNYLNVWTRWRLLTIIYYYRPWKLNGFILIRGQQTNHRKFLILQICLYDIYIYIYLITKIMRWKATLHCKLYIDWCNVFISLQLWPLKKSVNYFFCVKPTIRYFLYLIISCLLTHCGICPLLKKSSVKKS